MEELAEAMKELHWGGHWAAASFSIVKLREVDKPSGDFEVTVTQGGRLPREHSVFLSEKLSSTEVEEDWDLPFVSQSAFSTEDFASCFFLV